MATSGTNRGAADVLQAWADNSTIKCVLLSGNTTSWQTVATLRDMAFADAITADEPTGWTNYARVTLTSPSATAENVNDRGELDFSDITFPGLDSSGSTVDGVAFIREVTNDADSPLIGIIDVTGENATNRTPTGADFIVAIGSDGLIHLLTSS